jgi:hypothetical protein
MQDHLQHSDPAAGKTSARRLHTANRTVRRWLTAVTACAAIAIPLTCVSAQAQAAVQPSHSSTVAARDVAVRTLPPSIRPDTGGWGYVSDGNLRSNPNLSASIIDTIYNQWVNIVCWIDGGPNGFGTDRWFETAYYSLTGYLSSGVVSSQPTVGQCG